MGKLDSLSITQGKDGKEHLVTDLLIGYFPVDLGFGDMMGVDPRRKRYPEHVRSIRIVHGKYIVRI